MSCQYGNGCVKFENIQGEFLLTAARRLTWMEPRLTLTLNIYRHDNAHESRKFNDADG